MPRKLPADITFEDAEDEIFATRASLKADPDAADLLPETDDWLPMVETARQKDRDARMAVADATAARVIANHRLDAACTSFGDDLFLAVKKDSKSARWLQFFTVPVSVFVRQRFEKQVNKVRAWLGATPADPVVDAHRNELDQWTTAAEGSISKTHGIAFIRGAAQTAREQMAEDLTRERDGLAEHLAQRARERNLGRDWPSLFFRTESRKKAAAAEEAEPAPAAPPAPAPAAAGGGGGVGNG